MVSDAKAARLSVFLACIGIVLLFVSQKIPENKTVFQALNYGRKESICIVATVGWVKNTNSGLVFQLNDGNKLIAEIANPTAEQKSIIKKSVKLKVVGNTVGKKGEKRFVVSKVDVLD
jgi:hypothetical protein